MAILKFILGVILAMSLVVFLFFLVSGMFMGILYFIQVSKEILEDIRNG